MNAQVNLKSNIADYYGYGPKSTPVLNVNQLSAFGQRLAGWANTNFDGDKFFNGFGTTQLQHIDYYTLRMRSGQLFNENLYARGLIRRLITNEINTGLSPDVGPDEGILGVPEDSLTDWTETTENRFGLWAKDPLLCDWTQLNTFGALQRAARAEALISGDVLVVARQSKTTSLPMIQLINGGAVQTPFMQDRPKIRTGNTIKHGVERNKQGRVVAYWVRQEDTSFKRLPAHGRRTGRRVAWLVFGTDKRLDDVRGQPLLALILQSLKEIDRYRDSTQRKAVINSMLAMYIKKTNDKMSALPYTGGAASKEDVEVTDADGAKRSFNTATHIPGLVMEELQTGEEPIAFGNQGTDDSFGNFEEAIIQAVAWANEIPPEILKLAFSNNYSASQAAINEFKIYLNKVWSDWGETFCTPIYIEWLLSEVLLGKIKATGLLEAFSTPSGYDIFGAWTFVDWYGSIKPSTDMLKQAKGSELLLSLGLTTRAREARGATGTKYSKNVKKLRGENKLIAEANEPLQPVEAAAPVDVAGATAYSELLERVEALEEGKI